MLRPSATCVKCRITFFLDRSRRSGPRLEWKVGAFTVGAVMALTGMYFEERWLTGAAILVLVAGAFLHFPLRRDSEPADASDSIATQGPGEAPEPADRED